MEPQQNSVINCARRIIESSKVVRRGSGGNPSDILRHCAVTRHALSRSSRASLAGQAAPGGSACRRRPVSLTDDRRVRWHRPNQINIPPLRGSPRPSASSFLLRRFLPSFFVFADVPMSRLQFAIPASITSLLRFCFAPKTRCLFL